MTTRKRVVEAVRKRPSVELRLVRIVIEEDLDPDASFLEQDEFADRLAAYKGGEFIFVGVRAEAEVAVEGVLQTITSGGVWGTESDSEAEHFVELGADQYAELRRILKTVGVPTSEIPEAPQMEWRV